MKNNKIYWLCQIAGWSGMVAIETINYTFFIIGSFQLDYFISFVYIAVLGLFSTHLFKKMIARTAIFSYSKKTVWIFALLSTFALSVWMTFLFMIPPAVVNFKSVMDEMSFINLFASVVNWMRYVGVWVIIYFMYRLLEHNHEISQAKLKVENLARLTELELLKKQLNPHFLFNSLNSIKALVIIEPEKSRDAIVKLSELLRFTLNYGLQTTIPLKDEIAEAEKYLSLEQIRFGPRLKVEFEIDEDAARLLIPPALVLTLVENAIKHGIAKLPGPCAIAVRTRLLENVLTIQVINTGILANKTEGGIGLKNVQKRLENIFGARAGFTLFQQGDHVTATVKIQQA